MARILVIDDDNDLHRALCEILDRAGFETVGASDGEEGIASYRECPADVVVTDIFMPGTEGIETILAFRREFAEARIIAVSGGGERAQFSYLSYAQVLGARRTLVKPFTPSQFIHAIRETLREARHTE